MGQAWRFSDGWLTAPGRATVALLDAFEDVPDGQAPTVAHTGQTWGVYSGPGAVTGGYFDSTGPGAAYLEANTGVWPVDRIGAKWRFDSKGGTRTTSGTLALVTWADGGVVANGLGRRTSCHVTITSTGVQYYVRDTVNGGNVTLLSTQTISPPLAVDVEHTAEVQVSTGQGVVTIDGVAYQWSDSRIAQYDGEVFACFEPYYGDSANNTRCEIRQVWADGTPVAPTATAGTPALRGASFNRQVDVATSLTVTVPAETVPGDLLVLAGSFLSGSAVLTGPAGWTQLSAVARTGISTVVWTRTATGGDAGATVTVSSSASAPPALACWALQSVGTVGTPTTASQGSGSTSITVPTFTPSAGVIPLHLIAVALSTAGAASLTPPSGMFTVSDDLPGAADRAGFLLGAATGWAADTTVGNVWTNTGTQYACTYLIPVTAAAGGVAATVDPFETVTLPAGTWTQTVGPTVTVNGGVFVAPATPAGTTITFTSGSSTATYTVRPHSLWARRGGVLQAARVRAVADESPPAQPSAGLFYAMPADIQQHDRKVFAHYFGPYPRSFNAATEASSTFSTQYNNPASSAVKFYNKPIFRAQSASPTWQVDDCQFDIQTAYAAGLDGFMCDLLGLSGTNWQNYENLKAALRNLRQQDPKYNSFYVCPMVDCNGATGQASAGTAGDYVLTFKDTAYTLGDGRMIWGAFKGSTGATSTWLKSVGDYMTGKGTPNGLMPALTNTNQSSEYYGWAYGAGAWGYGADPASINNAADPVPTLHANGLVNFAPVVPQDVRPNSGYWDEAANTGSIRAGWVKAATTGADYVQLVTWSDYSETPSSPSVQMGYSVLDISGYYLTNWKTGAYPEILTDALYLSHREALSTATSQNPISLTRFPRAASTPTQDTVEVLSFLTAPADVTVTVGGVPTTYTAPAGMYAKTVPLAVGAAPSAQAVRSGQMVAQVTSTRPVVTNPYFTDMGYWWFSSLRGTTGQVRHPGPNPPFP